MYAALNWLHDFLQTGLGQAVYTGWGLAAVADFAMFKQFKAWHDIATYQWSVATFRWFQGIVLAVAGYYGVGGILSTASKMVAQ